jgi:beta-aspartyl-peptidase (threonine type)
MKEVATFKFQTNELVTIMTSPNYVILCHGGAGEVKKGKEKIVEEGVREAAVKGFSRLKSGGSALDAVEESVKSMEDNPNFNAGTGSVLTLKGTIEMDASISDGKTLNSGAVAMISSIRHPISLARIIMEKTDHVLIVGESAEKIGDKFGLERCDPRTPERVQMWKEAKKRFENGELKYLPRTMSLLRLFPDLTETVGAVAVDANSNCAAATSTGGLMLKLPGRLGDTPIIGAGNYADSNSAASCTGIGEAAVRLCLAKTACDYVGSGVIAEEAAKHCINLVDTRQSGLNMGVITVDKNCNYGLAHNTQNLVWALQTNEMSSPKSGIKYPTR